MKIFVILSILLIIAGGSFAADIDYFVYPDSHKVSVSASIDQQTVKITVINESLSPISNFFITAVTDDLVDTLSSVVDENTNKILTLEIESGSIYFNKYTTRWVVDSFTDSVTVLFNTNIPDRQNYSFCGNQPFPFFGIIEPILSNCCVGIRGNTNNDPNDQIDIGDLVFLVSYSFGEGPQPGCFEEADVDASGSLDIADIVYMVDYMFNIPTGPEPIICPN